MFNFIINTAGLINSLRFYYFLLIYFLVLFINDCSLRRIIHPWRHSTIIIQTPNIYTLTNPINSSDNTNRIFDSGIVCNFEYQRIHQYCLSKLLKIGNIKIKTIEKWTVKICTYYHQHCLLLNLFVSFTTGKASAFYHFLIML